MNREAEDMLEDQTLTVDTPLKGKRRGIKSIEVDDELLQDIRELLRVNAIPVLRNIFVDLHPADIADIIDHLREEERRPIFELLDDRTASDVLLELDPGARQQLLEELSQVKIAALISHLESDEATDIVAELPQAVAERILRGLPAEDSAEVKELLQYPEDSAGGIMSTELVAVHKNDTVKKAIRKVRERAREGLVVNTIYVIDDDETLLGTAPVQALVLNSPNRRMYKIMNPDVVTVTPDVDQEEVANTFKKYDLISIPVVDHRGKLLGRIRFDDIVDVIEEEHTEDVARIIGSDVEELERRSPVQIAWLRLPWVLVTLGIQFMAGVVVHFYDATLAQVILLASFMPIISAISGNTGLQSAAIVIRALGAGPVTAKKWLRAVGRQLQVTAIIGLACGLITGSIGAVWYGKWEFGLIVFLAMFLAINISGFIGTSFPMLSKRIGFDPAITVGPFETAFQDVIGITIFLTLATLMLSWIV